MVVTCPLHFCAEKFKDQFDLEWHSLNAHGREAYLDVVHDRKDGSEIAAELTDDLQRIRNRLRHRLAMVPVSTTGHPDRFCKSSLLLKSSTLSTPFVINKDAWNTKQDIESKWFHTGISQEQKNLDSNSMGTPQMLASRRSSVEDLITHVPCKDTGRNINFSDTTSRKPSCRKNHDIRSQISKMGADELINELKELISKNAEQQIDIVDGLKMNPVHQTTIATETTWKADAKAREYVVDCTIQTNTHCRDHRIKQMDLNDHGVKSRVTIKPREINDLKKADYCNTMISNNENVTKRQKNLVEVGEAEETPFQPADNDKEEEDALKEKIPKSKVVETSSKCLDDRDEIQRRQLGDTDFEKVSDASSEETEQRASNLQCVDSFQKSKNSQPVDEETPKSTSSTTDWMATFTSVLGDNLEAYLDHKTETLLNKMQGQYFESDQEKHTDCLPMLAEEEITDAERAGSKVTSNEDQKKSVGNMVAEEPALKIESKQVHINLATSTVPDAERKSTCCENCKSISEKTSCTRCMPNSERNQQQHHTKELQEKYHRQKRQICQLKTQLKSVTAKYNDTVRQKIEFKETLEKYSVPANQVQHALGQVSVMVKSLHGDTADFQSNVMHVLAQFESKTRQDIEQNRHNQAYSIEQLVKSHQIELFYKQKEMDGSKEIYIAQITHLEQQLQAIQNAQFNNESRNVLQEIQNGHQQFCSNDDIAEDKQMVVKIRNNGNTSQTNGRSIRKKWWRVLLGCSHSDERAFEIQTLLSEYTEKYELALREIKETKNSNGRLLLEVEELIRTKNEMGVNQEQLKQELALQRGKYELKVRELDELRICFSNLISKKNSKEHSVLELTSPHEDETQNKGDMYTGFPMLFHRLEEKLEDLFSKQSTTNSNYRSLESTLNHTLDGLKKEFSDFIEELALKQDQIEGKARSTKTEQEHMISAEDDISERKERSRSMKQLEKIKNDNHMLRAELKYYKDEIKILELKIVQLESKAIEIKSQCSDSNDENVFNVQLKDCSNDRKKQLQRRSIESLQRSKSLTSLIDDAEAKDSLHSVNADDVEYISILREHLKKVSAELKEANKKLNQKQADAENEIALNKQLANENESMKKLLDQKDSVISLLEQNKRRLVEELKEVKKRLSKEKVSIAGKSGEETLSSCIHPRVTSSKSVQTEAWVNNDSKNTLSKTNNGLDANEVNTLQAEIKHLTNRLQDQSNNSTRETESLTTELRKNQVLVEQVRKTAQDYKKECQNLKDSEIRQSEEIKRLVKVCAEYKIKCEDQLKDIVNKNDEIEYLKRENGKELYDVIQDKESVNYSVEESKKILEELRKENEKLKSEYVNPDYVKNLERERKDTEERIGKLVEEKQELEQKLSNMSYDKDSIELYLKTMKEKFLESEINYEKSESRIKELVSEFSSLKTRNESLEKKILQVAELEKQIIEEQQSLQEKTSELERCEDAIANLEASLSEILQEKEEMAEAFNNIICENDMLKETLKKTIGTSKCIERTEDNADDFVPCRVEERNRRDASDFDYDPPSADNQQFMSDEDDASASLIEGIAPRQTLPTMHPRQEVQATRREIKGGTEQERPAAAGISDIAAIVPGRHSLFQKPLLQPIKPTVKESIASEPNKSISLSSQNSRNGGNFGTSDLKVPPLAMSRGLSPLQPLMPIKPASSGNATEKEKPSLPPSVGGPGSVSALLKPNPILERANGSPLSTNLMPINHLPAPGVFNQPVPNMQGRGGILLQPLPSLQQAAGTGNVDGKTKTKKKKKKSVKKETPNQLGTIQGHLDHGYQQRPSPVSRLVPALYTPAGVLEDAANRQRSPMAKYNGSTSAGYGHGLQRGGYLYEK